MKMEAMQKMIDICIEYTQDKFDIIQFQHELEKIFLPDECKQTLEIDQHNAHNRLEGIRFSYIVDNLKLHSREVAKELIIEALIEQKRLSSYLPYAQ